MHSESGSHADRVDPWVEIDSQSLLHNLSEVQRLVGDRPIMAVVKCNAYGHGAVGVALVLQAAGIQRFAVVKVAEARALRDAGCDGTILNFGPFSVLEADELVRLGISQSVFSDSVGLLAEAAQRAGLPAKVHIKVDTGMSRVGVPHQLAGAFIERVDALVGVEIEGVFTTLTEEADFDLVQVERLEHVCEQVAAAGVSIGTIHAASSSGVSTRPGTYLDMVRPGNAIYGFEDLPGLDLQPTLSLKTRVTLVKSLAPGTTIGYHRVRRVEKEMLLATLPIGYADGYPPSAADMAGVLIRGERWPVVAYVSANHTLVDVTGSDVREQDEVVLIGTQGDSNISLQELARQTGSSTYQLATGLNPLLPRVFLS